MAIYRKQRSPKRYYKVNEDSTEDYAKGAFAGTGETDYDSSTVTDKNAYAKGAFAGTGETDYDSSTVAPNPDTSSTSSSPSSDSSENNSSDVNEEKIFREWIARIRTLSGIVKR